MGTVLRNIRPIAGPTDTIDCRFEDNKLTQVSEDPVASQPEDVLIDGKGKLAFPGFVNAHTHLAMVLLRGLADDVPLQAWLEDYVWPIERQLRPRDIYWCTLLALAEAIRGGTTCVADMYFHMDEAARAVEESGIRALLSHGIVADGLDRKGKAELDTTVRFAKTWSGAGDGRIDVAVSPHAVYTCGEEVWRAVIDVAHAHSLLIHTHVSESRDEVETCMNKTGLSPVGYLEQLGVLDVPLLAAHCVHIDSADIAILAKNGVSVAHCPKSNAKLGNGIAPVGALLRAGVNVALGTDGAASNNRLDMIEELRTAGLLQRATHEDPMHPSAAALVTMAVTNGRRALRMPSGEFRAGEPADLVLLETDRPHVVPSRDPRSTLVYASAASDVTDVIVDGQYLMRSGELVTIDEEKAKSEVIRLLHRITN